MTAKALIKDPLDRLNELERAFTLVLRERLLTGEIKRWDIHPEKLRLADDTYYIPDFRVVTADNTIEFYETKGFMRQHSAVKLKVAAELHPYRFFLVYRKRVKDGGGWDITEVCA